ncbi:hypothetical protein HanPSC8_Chr11g0495241 [Helianthus annuus]|nr:hypothetical protein HanIR_Chr11g0552411 [Helianthus annuus]KAJ0877012.1 hypothetical protein HanPSC8_Chr11g0495241 [Helianthus annuus]
MGLSRIEPMTSWWKKGRFTTTPAFFLFLWCPPNCIYGVYIQFNIPNLLFFFKRLGSGDPGGTNVGPPLAIICSGAVYYVQGSIMRERGPVFVTAFNPLYMIIVAVMGSIFLAEETYLGRRVLGAVIIVVGLYMVDWGKSKEQEHKDPSISMDEHTTPENQILGEESETNCNDQVIAIKTSDEICDEHDEIQPADV